MEDELHPPGRAKAIELNHLTAFIYNFGGSVIWVFPDSIRLPGVGNTAHQEEKCNKKIQLFLKSKIAH